MRSFTLFWWDGTTTVVYGKDINHACARHGYGKTFLMTLERWTENKDQDTHQDTQKAA